MQINFFEEFPDKDLEKAKLINFRSVIFIASKSLNEFLEYKEKLYKINPKLEAAYWPTLKDSYWISPFSNTAELNRVLTEIKTIKKEGIKLPKILVDLEPPIMNKILFITNLPYLRENKKIIENIFMEAYPKIGVYSAENPLIGEFHYKVHKLLGLSFANETCPYTKIFMLYTSIPAYQLFKKQIEGYFLNEIINNWKGVEVGLGTIAPGITNDPILSPDGLDRDLSFMKSYGINTVTIFRLGGLNKKYLQVIQKYI
jgi:hypothetical protein